MSTNELRALLSIMELEMDTEKASLHRQLDGVQNRHRNKYLGVALRDYIDLS